MRKLLLRLLLLPFAVALALIPIGARAQPQFTDVTQAAGVGYLQHSAQQAPNCIFGGFCEPERMSGGAAVGDFDGDGDQDLFVTRLDASDILFCSRLVETGAPTFQDCTAAAGLEPFDLQSNGAGFADIDNDGDLDLVVTTLGDGGDAINARNYLFVNDGSGVFTEEAIARGADANASPLRRVYSVAFGDYDRDGWLDMHTNEWLSLGLSNSRLLRNRGATAPGRFQDVTAAAGVELDGRDAFASSFTDLDGDGWPELVVAADFGDSRLFWNQRDGTFLDGTSAAGVGTDENGMGSTFADFDGDGDPDWFVTSIYDPDETCDTEPCGWGYTGNRLYRYDGGRVFSDATDAAGVRNGHWGWGAAFFDYDNDADQDLVMTNGVDFPGITIDGAFNADPCRLWENDGSGVMTEVAGARGVVDTGSGKGLLVWDYDEDGDLDLLIVNNAAGPRLYRNDGGSANGWLRVTTIGSKSTREGYGAKVSVRTTPNGPVQVREIGTSTHFLGQSERVAHFGLGSGSAPVAEVRVWWPSGASQVLTNVARNQSLELREPHPVPALGPAGLAVLAMLVVSTVLVGVRYASR